MAQSAPQQWRLTKNETVTSFESWKCNLTYGLSLNQTVTAFLTPGATWLKWSKVKANWGCTDDSEDVEVASRKTAAQMALLLEKDAAEDCQLLSSNFLS